MRVSRANVARVAYRLAPCLAYRLAPCVVRVVCVPINANGAHVAPYVGNVRAV